MEKALAVIPLLKTGSDPMFRQIYIGLRQAILNGTFRAGDRLPSTRRMAEQLKVSRTTVVMAYDQLLAEGYVTGRAGSGTFVSKDLARKFPARVRQAVNIPLSRFGNYAKNRPNQIVPPSLSGPRLLYDFAYARSNSDVFPFDSWSRLLTSRLKRAPAREFDYGSAAGSTALREAIAGHLRRTRGMSVEVAQVIIVNGSQQAIDIVSRVLINVGEPVAIENPQYQGARQIFQAAGARVVPVRVDAEGLVTSALPLKARLAYTTPSHQFPTGSVLPLARRLELLRWARRTNAVILEDDYDGEFRYEGQPIEPLQALDQDGRVVYVGTFSRTAYPSLRLGFLIAPDSLIATLVAAKWLSDRHTSTLEQETMADFIQSGAYERHLMRARRRLAEKRQELLDAIHDYLGNIQITGQNAGTHIVLRPKKHADEAAVIAEAAGRDVGIYGTSRYFLGRPGRTGFLLGYSRLTCRQIHEGIRRLGEMKVFQSSRS